MVTKIGLPRFFFSPHKDTSSQSRVFTSLRWPQHSPHQAWLECTLRPFCVLMALSVQKREWLIWIDTNSHCPAWPVTQHHWVIVACLNARWGRMENTQGGDLLTTMQATALAKPGCDGTKTPKVVQSSRISSVWWKSWEWCLKRKIWIIN